MLKGESGAETSEMCKEAHIFHHLCQQAGDNQLNQWQSPGLGSDPSWDKWVSLVPDSLQIVLGTYGFR